METPSSTRRVTRSQTLVPQSNNTIPISRKSNEDSEMGVSKSRTRNGKQQQQQDRSALIDITNDSPIVGVAMQTPSSAIMKLRSIRAKTTPGSGEALLRGQVKTLLQQVEEEAELSKLSFENRPFRHLQGLIGNSPTGLLAPTPANTPQVNDLSVDGSGSNVERPSPLVQEQLISQVVCDIFEGKNQASLESQKSILSRSLLLDFSEKSEISFSEEEDDYSSVITSESKERSSPDDDSASVWSIQVNASTCDEEEDEGEDYYLKGVDEIEEEEENEEDAGYDVDELCEGISKIFVGEKRMIPKFEGKHTKFVYNSDDEIAEEVVEDSTPRTPDSADVLSPSALCLKGLPTPRGKHLRFLDENDSAYSC